MATQRTELILTTSGGERVKLQLQDIGKAGEEALGKVKKGALEASAGLKVVDAAAGEIRSSISSMGGTISTVLGAAGGPIGALAIATTGAAAGFAALYKRAADYSGSVVDAAAKTGLSTKALQEQGFAFRQAGVSQEEYIASVVKLQREIGNARQGHGALYKALKDTDAQLLSQIQTAGNVERVMALLADKVASLSNEQDQAALTAAGFGKSSAGLLQVLRGGSAEFERAAAAARKYGLVIDEALLKKGDEASDAIDLLADAIRTNLYEAVLAVGPELSGMAKSLAEIVGSARQLPAVDKFLNRFSDRGQLLNEAEQLERQAGRLTRSATRTSLFGTPSPRFVDPKTGTPTDVDPGQALRERADELRRLSYEIDQRNRAATTPATGGAGDTRALLDSRIKEAAQAAGIDEAIFRALIGAESAFRHRDASGAVRLGPPTRYGRAIGYAQLLPGTAADLGVDPMDEVGNLNGGARYLRQMLGMFGGDYGLALAAYNWGPGSVQEAQRRAIRDRRDPGNVLTLPGLPDETRDYVNKILSGDSARLGLGKDAQRELEAYKRALDELKKLEHDAATAGLDGVAKLMKQRELAYLAWNEQADAAKLSEEERAAGHVAIWQKSYGDVTDEYAKEAAKRAAEDERAREKADREAERAAEKLAAQMAREAEALRQPFENFFENVQDGFGNLFTSILQDGKITSDEFVDIWKQAGARLVGELASLAINQAIVAPLLQVLVGSGGTGGSSSLGVVGSVLGLLGGGGGARPAARSSSGGGLDLTSVGGSVLGLGLEAYGLYTGQQVSTLGLVGQIAQAGYGALFGTGAGYAIGTAGATAVGSAGLLGAQGAAPVLMTLADGSVAVVGAGGSVTSLGAGASMAAGGSAAASAASVVAAAAPYIAAAVGAYLMADATTRYKHRSRKHIASPGDYAWLPAVEYYTDDRTSVTSKVLYSMFSMENHLLAGMDSMLGTDILGLQPTANEYRRSLGIRTADSLNEIRGSRDVFSQRDPRGLQGAGSDTQQFLVRLIARAMGTQTFRSPGIGDLRNLGERALRGEVGQVLGGGIRRLLEEGGDVDAVLRRIIRKFVKFDMAINQAGAMGADVTQLGTVLGAFPYRIQNVDPTTLAQRVIDRYERARPARVTSEAALLAYENALDSDEGAMFDGFNRLELGRLGRRPRRLRRMLGRSERFLIGEANELRQQLAVSSRFDATAGFEGADASLAVTFDRIGGLKRGQLRKQLPDLLNQAVELTGQWGEQLSGLIDQLRAVEQASRESAISLGSAVDALLVTAGTGGTDTASRYNAPINFLLERANRSGLSAGAQVATYQQLIDYEQRRFQAWAEDRREALDQRGVFGLAALNGGVQGQLRALQESTLSPSQLVASRQAKVADLLGQFRTATGDERVRLAQEIATLTGSFMDAATQSTGGSGGRFATYRSYATGVLGEVGAVTAQAEREQREYERQVRDEAQATAKRLDEYGPKLDAAFAQSTKEIEDSLRKAGLTDEQIAGAVADDKIRAQLVREKQLEKLTDILTELRGIRDGTPSGRVNEGDTANAAASDPAATAAFSAAMASSLGTLRSYSVSRAVGA